MWAVTASLCVLASCGRIGFDPLDAGEPPPTACVQRWLDGVVAISPVVLANINTPTNELYPFVSGDGQKLYFARAVAPLIHDFFVATRLGNDFISPMPLSDLNSVDDEVTLVVSDDELTAVFTSDRPGAGAANTNIWRATRATPTDAFANLTAAPFAAVNTAEEEFEVWQSHDQLRIVFSTITTNQMLATSSRASVADDFGVPTLLDELHVIGRNDCCPTLTADERVIVFAAGFPVDMDVDLYYATRTSRFERFSAARIVPGTESAVDNDSTPHLSADGCTLYFNSSRAGGAGSGDIWITNI